MNKNTAANNKQNLRELLERMEVAMAFSEAVSAARITFSRSRIERSAGHFLRENIGPNLSTSLAENSAAEIDTAECLCG
jgi:hypothetical protein